MYNTVHCAQFIRKPYAAIYLRCAEHQRVRPIKRAQSKSKSALFCLGDDEYYPEDGGNRFFWKVSKLLPDNLTSLHNIPRTTISEINSRKNKEIRHDSRMDQSRILHTVSKCQPPGKRNTGCPLYRILIQRRYRIFRLTQELHCFLNARFFDRKRLSSDVALQNLKDQVKKLLSRHLSNVTTLKIKF